MLIAVVLASDGAVIVARRNQTESTILFRDDFSGDTAFHGEKDDAFGDTAIQDGTFRLLPGRGDVYIPIPPEARDRPIVLQAQDIGVAVDVRSASSDANVWFGVFCRFGGFGTDTYVASVRPDGSWAIVRTTIGDRYVQRVLGSGRTQAIDSPLPADSAVHLRLDCLGQGETSLLLSVNDTVVGMVTDPSGLAPGNVGMAGSPTADLTFDNLVVTEIN